MALNSRPRVKSALANFLLGIWMGQRSDVGILVFFRLCTLLTASCTLLTKPLKMGIKSLNAQSCGSDEEQNICSVNLDPRPHYIRGHVTIYTVKKASGNSDVDNGGANQTTWGSENFYSHVVWFCATVVNIGIWRIPTWLFYSVLSSRPPGKE